MIKLTKINKYLFHDNYKDKNFFNCIILKKYLIVIFKLNILLYFFRFIIFQYKLKNQKITYNLKGIKNKKKNIRKNPKLLFIKYKHFIEELPYYNHSHLISKKIFWCWFQGEKNAPNISKACLNSFFRFCKSHEIIIIRENNINQYVHFPPFIINKLKKKCFTNTHFSDLLRLELLIKYGGTWVDSTVLITKYNDIFFNNDLFFFRVPNSTFSAGSSWFITAEKESPILKTTRDLLYDYWAKNDQIFDYFLFHFFFKMACNKYDKDYKKIPLYLNNPPHKLQFELFQPFKISNYYFILNISSIHKLTRKRITNKTRGLLYHHILEEFNSI